MTTTSPTIPISSRVPSPPLNYDYSVITSDTDPAATLLLDAKNEYNKQLISHLRQPVFNLMKTIYNSSEDICHQENTPENVLMVFQDNLAQVPKWNKTRRTKEYDEFLKVSKCDWFNELIKFCYITHVKILTIVNKPRPDVKLSISIPSGGVFFHSVCVAVARDLWRSPFLFNKNVGGKYEYQKNMRLIEQIIDNSVDACIRAHIPMKAILTEYLDNDVSVPSAPNENKLPPSQKQEPTDTQNNTSLPVSTSSSARILKSSKLKISDELEAFLDSPPEPKDGLEPINFTKPDELVDELEIIEPPLTDDESNHATPADILNDNAEIDELSEVVLAQSQSANHTNFIEQAPKETSANQDTNLQPKITPDESLPKADIQVNKSNVMDGFDLDSLPELNLASLTQIAEPDKPTTPEPNTNTVESNKILDSNNIPIISNPHSSEVNNNLKLDDHMYQPINNSEIKHIPISDMNEPGQIITQSELKQPMPKKKLIVEDLGVDDLDEVPLADKLNELNTFKKIANIPHQNSNNKIVNKQEFAFF